MNAGKRLDIALSEVLGYKRYGSDIAKEYGVTTQAISQLKKNEKSNDLMRKIAKDKGINLSWLEFGEGKMLSSRDIFYDGAEEPRSAYGKEKTISLEYYPDVYASAGGGAMVYESLTNTEPMKLSKAFVEDFLGITTQKNMHILNVKGDSMEPTILDGELIFVLPINGDGIVDGNIYVMMYENEIYVKRVRREAFSHVYNLSSDNPAIGDIVLTKQQSSDCKIIGEVVGQMRKRRG